MADTTTLKLPRRLKTRIARIARQIAREERMREFVREAMAADSEIKAGADVYRATDVHAWLERLARGGKPRRPAPWRR